MKRTGKLVALSALALAAVSIAACGSDSKESALEKLSVAYAYGYDVSHAGDQFGFDKLNNDGVATDIQEMSSPTDAIAALDRGDVQVANVAMSGAIPAIQEGAKLHLVLPAFTKFGFVVVGRPGIEQVSDLRGKSVMVSSPEGPNAAFVKGLLAKAGLNEGDYDFPSSRDSSDRIVALREGKVDAALLDQLDFLRLEQEGRGYTLLGRITDVQPDAPSNTWAFSDAFIKEHPEFVQQFVDRMLQGYAEAYSPEGRSKFIAAAQKESLSGEDKPLAPKIYDWYSSVKYWPTQTPVYDEATFATIVDYWKENGVLEGSTPSFDQVWDTSYWTDAS